MADLTKEQKKAMLRKWRAEQNRKYLLSKTNVRKLFRYLNRELEQEPCDHTARRTEAWLDAHCPPEKKGGILAEMRDMGGYCDCEVLLNCYERYELE